MKQLVISDVEGLSKLISKDKADITGEIKLKIPRFEAGENAKYEKMLNDWYNACGCELGAIFCIVSIGIYAIYCSFYVESFSWILLRNGLILFLSAALFGKLTGIILAKFRFRITVRNLIKRLK